MYSSNKCYIVFACSLPLQDAQNGRKLYAPATASRSAPQSSTIQADQQQEQCLQSMLQQVRTGHCSWRGAVYWFAVPHAAGKRFYQ